MLILTTFDLDEYVFDSLTAGASGFLLKDVPPEQLTAGIRAVAGGDALLAPAVTRRLIDEFVQAGPRRTAPPPELDELTPRELQVLQLVAQGLSNAEISTALVVEETTVKTHVSRLLAKLGLRDRVQAVVLAYESGLVGRPAARRRLSLNPAQDRCIQTWRLRAGCGVHMRDRPSCDGAGRSAECDRPHSPAHQGDPR